MSRGSVLEQRLDYRFNSPRLLEQALTHRSHGAPNNERLEFLGDGVLGCAVAEELYARFPDLSEGKLTRLRASVVREEALAEAARGLGLERHVRRGDVAVGNSILANAVEALIGAVFIDGGYETARKAVLTLLSAQLSRLDAESAAKDAKTQLQELAQSRHVRLPEYRVVSVQGEAHRQSFEVECVVADLGLSATGTGTSRQRAEQQAAQSLLEQIGP